jgi:uncharacterized protein (DUF2236 family)
MATPTHNDLRFRRGRGPGAAPARPPRDVADPEADARPRRPGGIPIPAGPHDWGLFGPESVSWKVHASPVLLVGGLRALLIQSLYPPAMAGIDQHSDYLERPLTRLQRTAEYVATVVYGDTASAERVAAMVRRLHSRVAGIDPITARAYSADDLEAKLWVHCVEIHSFLAAYRAYGGGLTDAEQDAYLAEQVAAAELMEIPREVVPASRLAYRAYFEMMRDRLCVSEASRDAIELVVHPPLTRELLFHQGTLRMMATAAVAISPRWVQRMAGVERSRPVYALAAAGTRASGMVMRAPLLNRAGGGLVGKRTVTLPKRALAAARG